MHHSSSMNSPHEFKLTVNFSNIVDDICISYDSKPRMNIFLTPASLCVSIDMFTYLHIWTPSCKQGQLWIHIWQIWWMIPAPWDRCLKSRRPLGTPQPPKKLLLYHMYCDNRIRYIKSIGIFKTIASPHFTDANVRNTIKRSPKTKVKPLIMQNYIFWNLKTRL